MSAYYNEIDPKAAVWLRELIKQGHIAPGDVDERSIVDVKPEDLKGYTQCHFFAGIGVWSYALRQAGWGDDRPIWTASCPCQPFSTAGQGKAEEDERHLFPVLRKLIAVRKPVVIVGEQVASKAAITWLDNVQSQLEEENYTCGAVVFPACGIGSPHQRQRTYWLAKSSVDESCGAGVGEQAGNVHAGEEQEATQGQRLRDGISPAGSVGRLDNTNSSQSGRRNTLRFTTGSIRKAKIEGEASSQRGQDESRQRSEPIITDAGTSGSLADNQLSSTSRYRADSGESQTSQGLWDGLADCSESCDPGPTNGLWRDADWLYCRDGKWRPVEPGTFPLADGAAERVGRLRGYGNAIVAEQAKIFIETAMDCIKEIT